MAAGRAQAARSRPGGNPRLSRERGSACAIPGRGMRRRTRQPVQVGDSRQAVRGLGRLRQEIRREARQQKGILRGHAGQGLRSFPAGPRQHPLPSRCAADRQAGSKTAGSVTRCRRGFARGFQHDQQGANGCERSTPFQPFARALDAYKGEPVRIRSHPPCNRGRTSGGRTPARGSAAARVRLPGKGSTPARA